MQPHKYVLTPQHMVSCASCNHDHVEGDCPQQVFRDDPAVVVALQEGILTRGLCCVVCQKATSTVGHVVAGTGDVEWKCSGCVESCCDWCGDETFARNRYCSSTCLVSHWRKQAQKKEAA